MALVVCSACGRCSLTGVAFCSGCHAVFRNVQIPVKTEPEALVSDFSAALKKCAPYVTSRLRQTSTRVGPWQVAGGAVASLGILATLSLGVSKIDYQDVALISICLIPSVLILRAGITTLRAGLKPEHHQAIKDLATWGDPLDVCADIQTEIDAAPLRHIKFTCQTKSWILYDEASKFFAVPIHEVVWAYRSSLEYSSSYGRPYTE